MKSFLESFKNPRVVMFAVAHWMLFIFLYFANPAINFNKWEDILFFMLAMFDLPAILVAAILWLPAYILDKTELFFNGILYTTIFTATLQWLMIGKIVFDFFSPTEMKMTKVSPNDE